MAQTPPRPEETLGWGEASERPTGQGSLEQLKTEYQQLLHRNALERLDQELKHFVRTMPRKPLPTYHGAAPPPPPPPRLDDPDAADRIYSKSSVQRYVLQRLASELHGPLELERDVVPYATFREVLFTPQAAQLPRLNPHVQSKPVLDDDEHGSAETSLRSPHQAYQFSSQPDPMSSSLSRMPSQQQAQQSNSNNNNAAVAAAPTLKTARLVYDMASFPNMQRGVRIHEYRAPK